MSADLRKALRSAGFHQVRDFQVSWALTGPDLVVDGVFGPKTARAAEEFLDRGQHLSTHFTASEFRCKCGCGRVRCHRELLGSLEILRARCYTRGLYIVSGYRCPDHNKAVGGATNSQHTYGRAADIPPRVEWTRVRDMHRFAGIGHEKTGLVSHVDRRDAPLAGTRNPTKSLTSSPAIWAYTR